MSLKRHRLLNSALLSLTLPCRGSTIDHIYTAGAVAAFIAGEEEHDVSNFFWRAVALSRHGRGDALFGMRCGAWGEPFFERAICCLSRVS
jgi:hypothetical protein